VCCGDRRTAVQLVVAALLFDQATIAAINKAKQKTLLFSGGERR
jgi:hypothetical protein